MRAVILTLAFFCSITLADDAKQGQPLEDRGADTAKTKAVEDKTTSGKYGYVLVSVTNTDSGTQLRLEQRIAGDLRKLTRVKTSRETSSNLYANAGLKDLVKQNGFDAVLVIEVGGNTDQRQTVGAVSHGSANLYGNTATGTVTSIPMVARTRTLSVVASLYDANTGELRWSKDYTETSGGLHARSDSHVIEDISDDVIKGLRRTGMLGQ